MVTASVIIPCFRSAPTLGACLRSLDAQTHVPLEIIVVDSTPDDDGTDRIVADHGSVQMHHHPTQLGPHEARNVGSSLARGDVLAFIDPDMTASPRWLETLLAAHAEGHDVVSGGVGYPDRYWAAAVHLTKYGWWLDTGEPDERSQVPAGNLALRRDVFESVGGFPPRYWRGDTELSYRLRSNGHRLWHVPKASTVHHDNPTWRGFLTERWNRGLDTADARSEAGRWTRVELLARMLAAPLTWTLMMGRSAGHAARAKKMVRWIAASPVIGLGLAAWVAGEWRAYGEQLWR